jgi:hypothetical protein
VSLERGPLSLWSTIEELFERESSDSRSRKPRLRPYGIRRADYATPLCPQKLTVTSPASGVLSAGIVRSRIQTAEFVCFRLLYFLRLSLKMYVLVDLQIHIFLT